MNLKVTLADSGRSAWAGAALAVFAGLATLSLPLDNPFTHLSYDLPYFFRPETQVDDVAIVYMDDDSHEKLRQPSLAAWDRSLHAQLIDRLAEWHARTVVFDIFFEGTTTNDQALVQAITRAVKTKVVVAGALTPISWKGVDAGDRIKEPLSALKEVASWGLIELGQSGDTIREHFPGQQGVPSLARRVAEASLPHPPNEPATRCWLNYYGPPGTIRPHSYYRLLLESNTLAGSYFSNKVVFVGANVGLGFTGGTGTDHFRTPYGWWDSRKFPGTEINATAYMNLVRDDWLRQVPPWIELLAVLTVGTLFGAGLNFYRPAMGVAVAAAGAVALAAVACVSAWQGHRWFSWAIEAGVQIPLALGWAVLAYTKRLRQEKEWLAEQLATATRTAVEAPAQIPIVRPADNVSPWVSPANVPTVREATGAPLIPDHELLRRVGEGAYGEIWLARNAIGSFHAVKIVYRKNFDSDEPFEREFRGLQKFMPISRSHPGLVHILHVGRHAHAGYIYYIMEVGDDEAAGQQIEPSTYSPKNLAREIKKRRHLPAADCLQLALDLTAALDFLHGQGLIHRDIKPSNIIFVKGAPKFADIGLVTDIAPEGKDASYLGTAGYIAPEGPGTPAADLFSLGKVLYQASMGLEVDQFPKLPDSMLQRPDRQAFFHLNEIILKACEPDRSRRCRSAAELRAELLRLQSSLPTETGKEDAS